MPRLFLHLLVAIMFAAVATPVAAQHGTAEISGIDAYNITNRGNFENPTNTNAGADRRLTATFLVPTQLRGDGGFPRQAQFGAKYAL